MAAGTREAATETHRGRTAVIAVAAVAVLVAVIAWLVMAGRADPPIIRGVREEITLFEDDDLQSALMEGVTAVGGEDRPDEIFPVSVAICTEGGEEFQRCPPGTYRVRYTCDDGAGVKAEPVESTLTVLPDDREPPVIEGVRDVTVEVGGTVSYRSGVTATDNTDPLVQLRVDASQVDLTRPGEYTVTYSVADSRGNEAAATATVTVVAPVEDAVPEDNGETAADAGTGPVNVTAEEVYALADRILGEITSSGMSQREKAKAIFTYVHGKIRYVGTSDKSNWLSGAYVGLTRGRGDCYNYFAASKLLLTRAGIPNVDLSRTGGNTDHYWQLVDVGGGYYHFDACPHPNGYPITSFLLTEAEVRDYSERCKSVRKNYYVYDYDACPVTVVGTPSETAPVETEAPPPAETLPPAETEPPVVEPPAGTTAPPPTETRPAENQDPAAESPAATDPLFPAGIPLSTENQTPAETERPAAEPPAETQPPAPTEPQAPAVP